MSPSTGSPRESENPTSRRAAAEALLKQMARSTYAKWFIWLAVHLLADDAEHALGLSS
jgi:hypothetical protein